MAEQRIADTQKRKPFCIEKSGNVQVPVYRRRQVKGEHIYTSYTVAEYREGKRLLHTFGSLADAQEKARTIANAIADGEQKLGSWSTWYRLQVGEAVGLIAEAGFTNGHLPSACRLLRDACKLVGGPDQVLVACQFYAANRPQTRITPKEVPKAVADFKSRRKGRLSQRRARTEACYLGAFETAFESKKLSEITALELSDMLDRKAWSNKTRNDFLGTVKLLFEDAISRGWTAVNIANGVKREKVKGSEVGIFTPAEGRTLLSSLPGELRAAIALWCFSGLRKEEIARLDWPEINQGLASGAIYLPGRKAKTGNARGIPIAPNLRTWLEKYRKPSGQVLPKQWDGRNLDSLTRHLACVSGIAWKANAPRHSYATYSLTKGDNAADVVKAMGNSLRMLERHYWSRTATVTKADAQEWFSIRPDDCAPAPGETKQQPGAENESETVVA